MAGAMTEKAPFLDPPKVAFFNQYPLSDLIGLDRVNWREVSRLHRWRPAPEIIIKEEMGSIHGTGLMQVLISKNIHLVVICTKDSHNWKQL